MIERMGGFFFGTKGANFYSALFLLTLLEKRRAIQTTLSLLLCAEIDLVVV